MLSSNDPQRHEVGLGRHLHLSQNHSIVCADFLFDRDPTSDGIGRLAHEVGTRRRAAGLSQATQAVLQEIKLNVILPMQQH